MTTRRFPPPWRADKIPGGYVVRDANGQALAYIYSRENAVRRGSIKKENRTALVAPKLYQ